MPGWPNPGLTQNRVTRVTRVTLRGARCQSPPAPCSAQFACERAVSASERPKVAPLGSFEAWARLVAGALVWLGEADPLGAVADERAGGVDLARAALGTLVQRWNDLATATKAKLRWKDRGIGVKAALDALYPGGNPAEGDDLDELREALGVPTVLPAGKVPGARQVAAVLARSRGRVVDGRKLLGEPDRTGLMVWRVDKTRSI